MGWKSVIKCELRVSSELKELAIVADFVAEFARRACLTADDTFAIQMAVDEACANVIEHAYGGQPDGILHVACRLVGDEVIVTIRDRGRPFDPSTVARPDVTAPLEERQEGGLGLHFMEALMDSLRFDFHPTAGNRLTMKKKVHFAKLPVCSEP